MRRSDFLFPPAEWKGRKESIAHFCLLGGWAGENPLPDPGCVSSGDGFIGDSWLPSAPPWDFWLCLLL